LEVLAFESKLGGRLFEQYETHAYEAGRITAWNPSARREFEWRASNFAPAMCPRPREPAVDAGRRRAK